MQTLLSKIIHTSNLKEGDAIGTEECPLKKDLNYLDSQFLPEWQNSLNSSTKMFFKIITFLGYGNAAIAIFALFFAFSSRDKAFYLLLVHTFDGFLNQQLKIIYRDPRPFMTAEAIEALDCSKTYGNPSGHATTVACFYTSLFLLIFYDKDFTLERRLIFNADQQQNVRKRNSSQALSIVSDKTFQNNNQRNGLNDYLKQTRVKQIAHWVSLLLLIALIGCIGISRVVLGAHSINQVIFGCDYGDSDQLHFSSQALKLPG
eukprot:403332200